MKKRETEGEKQKDKEREGDKEGKSKERGRRTHVYCRNCLHNYYTYQCVFQQQRIVILLSQPDCLVKCKRSFFSAR